MNILLAGLRGSGKSTVGRVLAERLGWSFVDLDDLTLKQLGCASVAAAWRERGEQAFRQAEVQVLKEVLGEQGRVVALGGGTPTAPGASDLLRQAQREGKARVIYLAADAATLRERISGEGLADRPALTGGDALAEVESVLAGRDGLYRELADHIVDAARPVEQVVGEIEGIVGV